MSRRQFAQYPIPANMAPTGEFCVQFTLPADPDWVGLFFGALYTLGNWTIFDQDTAHSAKTLADTFSKIINSFAVCGKQSSTTTGGGEGDGRMWRQNPTNPCILETSVDGICWCTVFDASKCSGFITQPGAGSAPPVPPGGSFEGCYTVMGQYPTNLPFAVYPGDTLEVTSAEGAAWDNDLLHPWNCPDGGAFFAGACGSGGTITPGDPCATAKHMSIVYNIGGTYYAAMAGPVTVGGTGPQQVLMSWNDSNIGDNSGSAKVCVKYTNHQTPTWSAVFDFTLSDNGWTVVPTEGGEWIGGIGFSSTYVDPYQNVYIHLILPAGTYTGASLDYTSSVVGENSYLYVVSGTETDHVPAIGNNHIDFTGALVAGNDFQADVHGASHVTGTNGQYVIKKITIQGTGTNPFSGR